MRIEYSKSVDALYIRLREADFRIGIPRILQLPPLHSNQYQTSYFRFWIADFRFCHLSPFQFQISSFNIQYSTLNP